MNKEKKKYETVESECPEDAIRMLSEMKVRSNKMKKRILIAAAGIFGALILLFCGLLLLERLIGEDDFVPPNYGYEFYEPYEGDIMQYPQYLACDRKIYYCGDPSGYGMRQEVSGETLGSFDSSVAFLVLYLDSIVAGNEEIYNSLFNEHYFEKCEPQGAFNPQMLYGAEIRPDGESTAKNGDKLTTYALYYKIHRNDGSFRRDIGSDMSRKQLITLRTDASGAVTIESLVTVYDTVISTPTE